jgi:hypothetical protein
VLRRADALGREGHSGKEPRHCGRAHQIVPLCGWQAGWNPWTTYEACRVEPGGGAVPHGFKALGLLFRTRTVSNARGFYCPSNKKTEASWTYEYHAQAAPWPSCPDDGSNPYVRCGYSYYPQLHETENVDGYELPRFPDCFSGQCHWSLAAPRGW